MCGIAGKIKFNGAADAEAMASRGAVDRSEISRMTDKLSHRGPDDAGVFVYKNAGLGQRRLSIIDLSMNGHQPMSDVGGRYWITFNGEIYNFKELRKELESDGVVFRSRTDTEVLVYLYKKYKHECVKYLRGMFALAIWDNNKEELFIARDRLGQKPLKYYHDKNCFIFASELKAILENPEVQKEPDFEAIDAYLSLKYIPSPMTGFKNIHKLEPAHYAVIEKNGDIKIEKYWDLDYSVKEKRSESDWIHKVGTKLEESVKIRMISDVPIGAHLSGGIDSSLITALMAKNSKEKIKTFSIGFEEAGFNELGYAKKVAEKYETDHHEFVVKAKATDILDKMVYHYEEPFADASSLPSWYLSEMTKKHVSVALNGDGGDENFAGYDRYCALKLHRILKITPLKKLIKASLDYLDKKTNKKQFKKASRLLAAYSNSFFEFYFNIIQYFTEEQKNKIYSGELKKAQQKFSWKNKAKSNFEEKSKLGWLNQVLYTGVKTHLPDDLLVKVDIASMAHSLEVRSPFLDHEFMEMCAQVPQNLKLRGCNKKYLLKKITEKYVPRECIYRKKQGFSVPLENWFQGELNGLLKESVLHDDFLKYGFNKKEIKKMISDHQEGKVNYENQLWTLLILSKWFKTWF